MRGVGRERKVVTSTIDGVGRGRSRGDTPSTIDSDSISIEVAFSIVGGTGRGRGPITSTIGGVVRGRRRGAGANKEIWTNVVVASIDSGIDVIRGRGTSLKRARIVGMGMLQTESSYRILNIS